MPQSAWNITGIQGNTYKLGLFHGDDTGHVVLHCNDRVVAIDFNVGDSRTYSLFLDDELCEVSIDPAGPGARPGAPTAFDYTCRINTEVKTPLNEQRRRLRADQARVEKLRMGVATLVAVVIVLLLVL